MITTILTLVACIGNNNPAAEVSAIDDRPEWELFAPQDSASISVPSTVTWYADPRFSEKIASATKEWEVHLSCGVNFKQVEHPEDAEIAVICSDFPGANPAFAKLGEDAEIILSEKACKLGGSAMARFAVAMGMGFQQQFSWFRTAVDGTGAYAEILGAEDSGWSALETDGWRAWALKKGAPGCGAEELKWSWEQSPGMYKTHPSVDEIEQMLSAE